MKFLQIKVSMVIICCLVSSMFFTDSSAEQKSGALDASGFVVIPFSVVNASFDEKMEELGNIKKVIEEKSQESLDVNVDVDVDFNKDGEYYSSVEFLPTGKHNHRHLSEY